MKIERIDDKTVKCFLSNEELEEYQIDYKDFVMRNEKAKQVVHDIIVQAAEQVGYKPPKYAFDMQIMMLPDQGLLLTFSESESVHMPGMQQLIDYLREMKQVLENAAAGKQPAIGSNGAAGQQAVEGQNTAEGSGSVPQEKPGKAIFVFDSIGQVMDYAAALPGNLRVESALYEMDGKFYLYLQKGSAAYEKYSRTCIQALEFGRLYGTEEMQLLPMRERGGCLIEEKALQKLRGK